MQKYTDSHQYPLHLLVQITLGALNNLCSTEGFTFTGSRNAVNQYTWQTGKARELMLLEVAQGLEKYLSTLMVGWQLFRNILHCLQGFPQQN